MPQDEKRGPDASEKRSPWLRIGLEHMVATIQDGKHEGPANTIRKLLNIRWQDFEIGVISKLNTTEAESAAYFEVLKSMTQLIQDVLRLKIATLNQGMVDVLKKEDDCALDYERFRDEMITLIKHEKFKKTVSSCFFCSKDSAIPKLDLLLKTYDPAKSKVEARLKK